MPTTSSELSSKGKVGRRTFIISAASAVSAGLVTYAGGWWPFGPTENKAHQLVTDVLRQRLSYLKLDEEGLNSFADDLLSRLPSKERMYLPPADVIVKRFMMSSDFFHHDADESRTVHYLSYYDPYERGCANPFAMLG